MRWTVKGYATGPSRSVIDDWVQQVSKKVAAKFDLRRDVICSREISEWPYDYAHKLLGSDKIYEFKFAVQRIAYRPLFSLGPFEEEITVLIFAEERSNRLTPPTAISIAERRMAEVKGDPSKAILYDG